MPFDYVTYKKRTSSVESVTRVSEQSKKSGSLSGMKVKKSSASTTDLDRKAETVKSRSTPQCAPRDQRKTQHENLSSSVTSAKGATPASARVIVPLCDVEQSVSSRKKNQFLQRQTEWIPAIHPDQHKKLSRDTEQQSGDAKTTSRSASEKSRDQTKHATSNKEQVLKDKDKDWVKEVSHKEMNTNKSSRTSVELNTQSNKSSESSRKSVTQMNIATPCNSSIESVGQTRTTKSLTASNAQTKTSKSSSTESSTQAKTSKSSSTESNARMKTKSSSTESNAQTKTTKSSSTESNAQTKATKSSSTESNATKSSSTEPNVQTKTTKSSSTKPNAKTTKSLSNTQTTANKTCKSSKEISAKMSMKTLSQSSRESSAQKSHTITAKSSTESSAHMSMKTSKSSTGTESCTQIHVSMKKSSKSATESISQTSNTKASKYSTESSAQTSSRKSSCSSKESNAQLGSRKSSQSEPNNMQTCKSLIAPISQTSVTISASETKLGAASDHSIPQTLLGARTSDPTVVSVSKTVNSSSALTAGSSASVSLAESAENRKLISISPVVGKNYSSLPSQISMRSLIMSRVAEAEKKVKASAVSSATASVTKSLFLQEKADYLRKMAPMKRPRENSCAHDSKGEMNQEWSLVKKSRVGKVRHRHTQTSEKRGKKAPSAQTTVNSQTGLFEGTWGFSLHVSPLSTADMGSEKWLSLLSTSKYCKVNLLGQRSSINCTKQTIECGLYFERLLDARSAMVKLPQMPLSGETISIEITRQHSASAAEDRVVANVEMDMTATGTLATLDASTMQQSKDPVDDKSVYISNIPEYVKREVLFVIFPFAYAIQEPRRGASVLQFRSKEVAADVLKCYTRVSINSIPLVLTGKDREARPNSRTKQKESASKEEIRMANYLAEVAVSLTELANTGEVNPAHGKIFSEVAQSSLETVEALTSSVQKSADVDYKLSKTSSAKRKLRKEPCTSKSDTQQSEIERKKSAMKPKRSRSLEVDVRRSATEAAKGKSDKKMKCAPKNSRSPTESNTTNSSKAAKTPEERAGNLKCESKNKAAVTDGQKTSREVQKTPREVAANVPDTINKSEAKVEKEEESQSRGLADTTSSRKAEQSSKQLKVNSDTGDSRTSPNTVTTETPAVNNTGRESLPELLDTTATKDRSSSEAPSLKRRKQTNPPLQTTYVGGVGLTRIPAVELSKASTKRARQEGGSERLNPVVCLIKLPSPKKSGLSQSGGKGEVTGHAGCISARKDRLYPGTALDMGLVPQSGSLPVVQSASPAEKNMSDITSKKVESCQILKSGELGCSVEQQETDVLFSHSDGEHEEESVDHVSQNGKQQLVCSEVSTVQTDRENYLHDSVCFENMNSGQSTLREDKQEVKTVRSISPQQNEKHGGHAVISVNREEEERDVTTICKPSVQGSDRRNTHTMTIPCASEGVSEQKNDAVCQKMNSKEGAEGPRTKNTNMQDLSMCTEKMREETENSGGARYGQEAGERDDGQSSPTHSLQNSEDTEPRIVDISSSVPKSSVVIQDTDVLSLSPDEEIFGEEDGDEDDQASDTDSTVMTPQLVAGSSQNSEMCFAVMNPVQAYAGSNSEMCFAVMNPVQVFAGSSQDSGTDVETQSKSSQEKKPISGLSITFVNYTQEDGCSEEHHRSIILKDEGQDWTSVSEADDLGEEMELGVTDLNEYFPSKMTCKKAIHEAVAKQGVSGTPVSRKARSSQRKKTKLRKETGSTVTCSCSNSTARAELVQSSSRNQSPHMEKHENETCCSVQTLRSSGNEHAVCEEEKLELKLEKKSKSSKEKRTSTPHLHCQSYLGEEQKCLVESCSSRSASSPCRFYQNHAENVSKESIHEKGKMLCQCGHCPKYVEHISCQSRDKKYPESPKKLDDGEIKAASTRHSGNVGKEVQKMKSGVKAIKKSSQCSKLQTSSRHNQNKLQNKPGSCEDKSSRTSRQDSPMSQENRSDKDKRKSSVSAHCQNCSHQSQKRQRMSSYTEEERKRHFRSSLLHLKSQENLCNVDGSKSPCSCQRSFKGSDTVKSSHSCRHSTKNGPYCKKDQREPSPGRTRSSERSLSDEREPSRNSTITNRKKRHGNKKKTKILERESSSETERHGRESRRTKRLERECSSETDQRNERESRTKRLERECSSETDQRHGRESRTKRLERECSSETERHGRESRRTKRLERECSSETERQGRESRTKRLERECSSETERQGRESRTKRLERECSSETDQRHGRESRRTKRLERECSSETDQRNERESRTKRLERECSSETERQGRESRRTKRLERECSSETDQRHGRESRRTKRLERECSSETERHGRESRTKRLERECSSETERQGRESRTKRLERECSSETERQGRESRRTKRLERECSSETERHGRESRTKRLERECSSETDQRHGRESRTKRLERECSSETDQRHGRESSTETASRRDRYFSVKSAYRYKKVLDQGKAHPHGRKSAAEISDKRERQSSLGTNVRQDVEGGISRKRCRSPVQKVMSPERDSIQLASQSASSLVMKSHDQRSQKQSSPGTPPYKIRITVSPKHDGTFPKPVCNTDANIQTVRQKVHVQVTGKQVNKVYPLEHYQREAAESGLGRCEEIVEPSGSEDWSSQLQTLSLSSQSNRQQAYHQAVAGLTHPSSSSTYWPDPSTSVDAAFNNLTWPSNTGFSNLICLSAPSPEKSQTALPSQAYTPDTYCPDYFSSLNYPLSGNATVGVSNLIYLSGPSTEESGVPAALTSNIEVPVPNLVYQSYNDDPESLSNLDDSSSGLPQSSMDCFTSHDETSLSLIHPSNTDYISSHDSSETSPSLIHLSSTSSTDISMDACDLPGTLSSHIMCPITENVPATSSSMVFLETDGSHVVSSSLTQQSPLMTDKTTVPEVFTGIGNPSCCDVFVPASSVTFPSTSDVSVSSLSSTSTREVPVPSVNCSDPSSGGDDAVSFVTSNDVPIVTPRQNFSVAPCRQLPGLDLLLAATANIVADINPDSPARPFGDKCRAEEQDASIWEGTGGTPGRDGTISKPAFHAAGSKGSGHQSDGLSQAQFVPTVVRQKQAERLPVDAHKSCEKFTGIGSTGAQTTGNLGGVKRNSKRAQQDSLGSKNPCQPTGQEKSRLLEARRIALQLQALRDSLPPLLTPVTKLGPPQ